MSVAAPRRKKPTSVDEITRTLRIYDLLVDEMQRKTRFSFGIDERMSTLAIAERIAARTED